MRSPRLYTRIVELRGHLSSMQESKCRLIFYKYKDKCATCCLNYLLVYASCANYTFVVRSVPISVPSVPDFHRSTSRKFVGMTSQLSAFSSFLQRNALFTRVLRMFSGPAALSSSRTVSTHHCASRCQAPSTSHQSYRRPRGAGRLR